MTLTFDGPPNQIIVLLGGSILNPGHFDIGLLNPLLIGGGTVDVGNVPLGDFTCSSPTARSPTS